MISSNFIHLFESSLSMDFTPNADVFIEFSCDGSPITQWNKTNYKYSYKRLSVTTDNNMPLLKLNNMQPSDCCFQ